MSDKPLRCPYCGSAAYLCDRPEHGSCTWALHCRRRPHHNLFGEPGTEPPAEWMRTSPQRREGRGMTDHRSRLVIQNGVAYVDYGDCRFYPDADHPQAGVFVYANGVPTIYDGSPCIDSYLAARPDPEPEQ